MPIENTHNHFSLPLVIAANPDIALLSTPATATGAIAAGFFKLTEKDNIAYKAIGMFGGYTFAVITALAVLPALIWSVVKALFINLLHVIFPNTFGKAVFNIEMGTVWCLTLASIAMIRSNTLQLSSATNHFQNLLNPLLNAPQPTVSDKATSTESIEDQQTKPKSRESVGSQVDIDLDPVEGSYDGKVNAERNSRTPSQSKKNSPDTSTFEVLDRSSRPSNTDDDLSDHEPTERSSNSDNLLRDLAPVLKAADDCVRKVKEQRTEVERTMDAAHAAVKPNSSSKVDEVD